MPCYDKKLEASRKDFYSDAYATRDVDCVITTGELVLMMEAKGFDPSLPLPGEDSSITPLRPFPRLPDLLQHPGTSSGSYLQAILASLSQRNDPVVATTKAVRSQDYTETTLADADTGAVVFKGAKCYGFRNLQNVVRKVGRDAGVTTAKGAATGPAPRGRRRATASAAASSGYDYVEVMACPSGCVNGGGQIRPPASSTTTTMIATTDEEGMTREWADEGVLVPSPDNGGARWGDRAWTSRVEAAYWVVGDDPETPPTPPPTPPITSVSTTISISDCSLPSIQAEEADSLSLRVLSDLCLSASSSAPPPDSWLETMSDPEAEKRRIELFRTQYRAVESSDMIGLTVQW